MHNWAYEEAIRKFGVDPIFTAMHQAAVELYKEERPSSGRSATAVDSSDLFSQAKPLKRHKKLKPQDVNAEIVFNYLVETANEKLPSMDLLSLVRSRNGILDEDAKTAQQSLSMTMSSRKHWFVKEKGPTRDTGAWRLKPEVYRQAKAAA
jgi:hypothetical protein